MEEETVFSQIIAKKKSAEIIYEDDDVIAFKDINPIDKVHLLIIPKKHIENLFSCEKKHNELLSKMLLLAPKLAKENGLEGFRVMINSGEKGGQEVFHIHFHVYGGSEKIAKI